MSKLFACPAIVFVVVFLLGAGCESAPQQARGGGGAGPMSPAGYSCQVDQALCGDACVDLATNPQFCGSCDNACPAGTTCMGGACACQSGLSSCSGECVELASNPTNCGACGTVCVADQVCSLGACATGCDDGLTQCGQACVDAEKSVLNCGGCGNACPAGRLCQAGSCACENPVQTDCNGTCVDTATDPANCGACGTACMGGASCSGGVCAQGTSSTTGSGGTSGTAPGGFINEQGQVTEDGNALGIEGYWYAYGDGVTSDRTGNPWVDGAYCILGEAPGDEDFSAHWGAGIGLDFNLVDGDKMPYEFEGKINGFRMTLVGSAPTTPRVNMVNSLDADVTPFIDVTLDSTETYWIAEARVPLSWDVENSGARVDNGILYSIQILAPGAEAAGPIDVCLTEFEPIYDPNYTPPVVDDGTYINSDGLIQAANNDYGIEGPVYVISDGNSTTQTGNPYSDGKYCVSGTFSAGSDDWGAGIAFDLNNPGGAGKEPYLFDGVIEGFRLGISGTTPGFMRIQFITNEPQEGDQPFLRAIPNSTLDYRIDWAQVPTSWDVADAGAEVGSEIYTMQVYLEGDQAGPFDICIDEFLPVTSSDIGGTADPTIDPAVLTLEYDNWKRRHFQDCGDGSACIPTGDGDCISEGIGYGMLITAGMDDQAAFDQLWAYFERNKNEKGVMTWTTSACGAANGSGSATDGELDAAMALVQAGCKWGGNYQSDAVDLITAIGNSEVASCNASTVLKPGDSFGGCDETNPSYIAPGYYRVFQTLTGDSTWTDLLNDGYALLSSLQSGMNGLVPDWCNSDAVPESGDRGQYGPDASRTPWRMATDHVWNAEPRAATFLENFRTYVESQGGVARAFTPNSNYRGAAAMSGWPAGGAVAKEFTDAWLETSVDDGTYFQGTLRMVYLLLATGRFSSGC